MVRDVYIYISHNLFIIYIAFLTKEKQHENNKTV